MELKYNDLPIIETERLRMRNSKITDADSYKDCVENNDVFEYWGSEMPKQSAIQRIERNLSEKREFTWAISYKNIDKAFGDIAVFNFEGTRKNRRIIAEIGWNLIFKTYY